MEEYFNVSPLTSKGLKRAAAVVLENYNGLLITVTTPPTAAMKDAIVNALWETNVCGGVQISYILDVLSSESLTHIFAVLIAVEPPFHIAPLAFALCSTHPDKVDWCSSSFLLLLDCLLFS